MAKDHSAPPAYTDEADVLDVLIVGAGISGINAAYRLQQQVAGTRYAILEARAAMGGTWDLFRYPGIRSDSDLHTFGFSWRPWASPQDIAPGEDIRRYIKDSARENGIDAHIRYGHRVVRADWRSDEQVWRLDVDATEGERGDAVRRIVLRARWVMLCSGYYDYHAALPAAIPGLDSFAGQVLHPQFWPEDFDATGKRIAIVGSGATAVTLLPALARDAARVSMVQRSPGYILSRPHEAPAGRLLHRWLPTALAYRLLRWINITLPFLFFLFCRHYPRLARRALRRRTTRLLPIGMQHDPHFNPAYNPWEQRLCVCPDSDFFDALRDKRADIVTGAITAVTPDGIRVAGTSIADAAAAKGGETFVPADVIVTATGLKMQIAGGATLAVDGKDVDITTKFVWRGVMLQDLPNLSMTFGYTNASWTLGADTTAIHVCRLINELRREGKSVVTPRMSDEDAQKVHELPLINISSTYVRKAQGILPKAGDIGPWRTRWTYQWDILVAMYGGLRRGLQYF